jgi:hypothetical protein
MQFTKTFVTLALAASALAVPTGDSTPSGAQCCQNVQNSSTVDSVTKGIIFTLLGIDISNLNVPIGTGCAPLVVGGGVSWYVPTICTKLDISFSS